MKEPCDPLTFTNLMMGFVVEFQRQPRIPLSEDREDLGPGIYTLYYNGKFPAYRAISDTQRPIYVGKAVQKGARAADSVNVNKPYVTNRIRKHRQSISDAKNLHVEDFEYRYLTVVPVWVTQAESFLIDYYRPVWNKALDGFGNNDPGKGRAGSEASWWDTMHPGRKWASKLRRVKSQRDALDIVEKYFETPFPHIFHPVVVY